MGITATIMVPHPPLIVPEVGKGDERQIASTIEAYHQAARLIQEKRPETIVLLSPHQTMYADYFHISPNASARGDFGRFRAGDVSIAVDYDTEFVEALSRLADQRGIPAGTLGERDAALDHGTLVPLYFINQYWTDYKLLRVGLSGLPLATHYEFGVCIREIAKRLGRNVCIVASGDLSHRLKEDGTYGYREEGPQYDSRIMEVMGNADFGKLLEFSEYFLESAGECGHRSFTIMAGALNETAVEAKRLSYEGPFGVGYGVCTYEVKGADPTRNFGEQYEEKQRAKLSAQRAQEDEYISLARKTIEEYILLGKTGAVPEHLPKEMYEKTAGVFVSIKEDGRLRGCIGTIQATKDSIAQEIIANAVSAACRDPRFDPIRPEELERLAISVDVLGDTERIDSPEELDVKRYGVVVTKGHKRGLLLPNLEGVDTVEEQISIAKKKAGISEHEDVQLERFEVVRHCVEE